MHILYDYDGNVILCKAIKNRQAKTLVDAWEELHKKLTAYGHTTKNFVLDNEISEEFKIALHKYGKTFELTPPNIYHRKAAKRAIRTFKISFWQVWPHATKISH